MSDSRTIAVLGASSNRRKYGNKCVRAYLDEGWTVYPVNPHEERIEGLETHARLADVPGELDRISVYLPPPITRELLDEIVERGAGEVWFNPGAADRGTVEEARERGVQAIAGCSIVDIGRSPGQYPG